MINSVDEIRAYVKLIDLKLLEFKKKRESRYSVDWGLWSRDMNTNIQETVKSPDASGQTKVRVKYLFSMWIATSRLLESYYKHRLSHMAEKRKLQEEIADLRDLVLNKDFINEKDLPEGLMDIIRTTMGDVKKGGANENR